LDLPVAGRIHVAGLQVSEAQQQITRLFDRYYHNSQVAIEIVEYHSQPISVLGAVTKSGIYDIEGYGAGSGVNGLYFLRCQAFRNARFGFQFWEPTPPSTPGFLPRNNIVFESCSVDGGVSPKHGRQALELSQPRAIRSALPMYQNVRIVDLNCTGTVILNCVHNVIFAGGRMRSPSRFLGNRRTLPQHQYS
jgi:hypothetical protein